MDYKKYLQPDIISKISSLELRARLVVEGFITGLHKSPYHGFSVEFSQHRQYMPGDEPKKIDWKIYGRTDKFFIKQYEEETNLKCYIALDCSASMGFSSQKVIKQKSNFTHTKFDYALSLAAAFAFLMIRQQDAVGGAIYDSEIKKFLPAYSRPSYLQEVINMLASATPSHITGTAKALNVMAERIKRRGLVIVISDFLDDPQEVISALKHFRHKQNEVLAIQVLDPLELSFEFGNGATFRDMETNEKMVTQPLLIKDSYVKAVEDFTLQIKQGCRNSGIDYLLLDTSVAFDKALIEYINKRRKLG